MIRADFRVGVWFVSVLKGRFMGGREVVMKRRGIAGTLVNSAKSARSGPRHSQRSQYSFNITSSLRCRSESFTLKRLATL